MAAVEEIVVHDTLQMLQIVFDFIQLDIDHSFSGIAAAAAVVPAFWTAVPEPEYGGADIGGDLFAAAVLISGGAAQESCFHHIIANILIAVEQAVEFRILFPVTLQCCRRYPEPFSCAFRRISGIEEPGKFRKARFDQILIFVSHGNLFLSLCLLSFSTIALYCQHDFLHFPGKGHPADGGSRKVNRLFHWEV